MYFDPMYMLFMLPALLLSLLASMYVKMTFAKYSQVPSRNGYTGAQAAEAMMRAAGITNVRIEKIGGFLTDHYDPSAKVLRLSPDVYSGYSLSAIGVACHEAGHALQDAQGYLWMGVRSALVPAASIGSKFSYFVLMLGFLFQSSNMVLAGIVLFALAVAFSVVTLPVEWNASARAKVAMVNAGLLANDERDDAGSVLNAAFLTYVASAVSALLTLLYYVLRYSAMRRRD